MRIRRIGCRVLTLIPLVGISRYPYEYGFSTGTVFGSCACLFFPGKCSRLATLIHVRSREGGVYWSESDLWSPLVAVAKKFNAVAEAQAFCRARKFNDVEILVLREGQPPMVLPLDSLKTAKA